MKRATKRSMMAYLPALSMEEFILGNIAGGPAAYNFTNTRSDDLDPVGCGAGR